MSNSVMPRSSEQTTVNTILLHTMITAAVLMAWDDALTPTLLTASTLLSAHMESVTVGHSHTRLGMLQTFPYALLRSTIKHPVSTTVEYYIWAKTSMVHMDGMFP
jgi:hypothetical protein